MNLYAINLFKLHYYILLAFNLIKFLKFLYLFKMDNNRKSNSSKIRNNLVEISFIESLLNVNLILRRNIVTCARRNAKRSY